MENRISKSTMSARLRLEVRIERRTQSQFARTVTAAFTTAPTALRLLLGCIKKSIGYKKNESAWTAIIMTHDRYLTLKEVCEMFSVSRSTVWRWRSERGLRVVTIGGVTRIREADLQVFIGRHEQSLGLITPESRL